MTDRLSTMNTEQVSPRERIPYWTDWIDRLFCGLRSDLYGDTDFDGRMATAHAGDVVLTRLESDRHRVMRSRADVRASELGYLKIVAPFHGCAGVEQKGREAWVTPGEWSIYDTTDTYAVSNPVHVEHLIVMVPKAHLAERGLAIDELMARRLGGQGGIARVTLETMRSAWRELPGMSDEAARSLGELITQCVHLSLLDLAGCGTRGDAARDAARAHQAARAAPPRRSGTVGRADCAGAELQPAPPLQRVRRRARRRRRLPAGPPARGLPQRLRRPALGRPLDHRHRARARLLEHGALQPRVPQPRRHVAERIPARPVARVMRAALATRRRAKFT
jgi:hypothetical protein